MTPAETLLSRLDGVRQLGAGRWLARCPSHEDRRPSLSMQETSDGTLLVHCFAHCAPGDILRAIGMTLADLFPNQLKHHRGRQRPFMTAKDVLTLLDHERVVILAVANEIRRGYCPDDRDLGRAADAGRRIERLREVLRA